MDIIENSTLAYTVLDNALKDIAEKTKRVEWVNTEFFFENDKLLSDYVNKLQELKKSLFNFDNLFNDFMLELEQKEFEDWENEEIKIEEDYYGG